MMSEIEFTFSSNSYELRRFVRRYRAHLPVVVTVTQGYCGLVDSTTFGVGETYIITEICKQKRVIVETAGKQLLSIPEDHDVVFEVLTQGISDSKPKRVSEILTLFESMRGRGDLYIKPHSSQKLSFNNGSSDRVSRLDDQSMMVVNDYDDVYLVACPVHDGHIYERKMGIPVFVDIQLAQSTGLVDQRNERVYHQVLDNLRTEALSFETKEKLGNPEIMLYRSLFDGIEDYEYIEPMHYVTCLKARELLDSERRGSGSEVPYDNASPSVTYDNTPPSVPPLPPRELKKGQRLGKRTVSEPIIPKAISQRGSYPSASAQQRSSLYDNPHERQEPAGPESPPPNYAPAPPGTAMSTSATTNVYLQNSIRKKSVPVLSTAESKQNPRTPPDIPPRRVPKTKPRTSLETEKSPNKTQSKRTSRYESTTTQDIIRPPSDIDRTITDEQANAVTIEPPTDNRDDATQPANKQAASSTQPGEYVLTQASLPKDIMTLKVQDVSDCLRVLHLEKYIADFKEKQIDGALLSELDDIRIFMDEFKFDRFDAIKIVKFIKGWRPEIVD